jgi:hypothetical protein
MATMDGTRPVRCDQPAWSLLAVVQSSTASRQRQVRVKIPDLQMALEGRFDDPPRPDVPPHLDHTTI